MKLLIAVIQNEDSKKLQQAFNKKGVRATKLSTTGGFLSAVNTTFMVGVEDHKVDDVLELIAKYCKTRTQTMISSPTYDITLDAGFDYPIEVEVGGATVFILPVDAFKKF